jgi:hypothetical protein
LAYGALGLRPREFERLQPHEFYALLDGYVWRRENRLAETAYWVANLLNMSGKVAKREITPLSLLKPFQPKEKRKRNIQEDAQYLKELFKDRL